MDPDGCTEYLLSSSPDDIKMERRDTSLVLRNESTVTSDSASLSEIDERRFRFQNRTLTDIPQSVQTTRAGSSASDSSSVGSDDVVSYCYTSEKCILSRNCSVESVFRDAEWNMIGASTTIVIPSAKSCKTSSSNDLTLQSNGDEETTLYLCEEGSYSIDEEDAILKFVNSKSRVLGNGNTEETHQTQMLLSSNANTELRDRLLSSVKIECFIIGTLIGLLMQFSTMGANFLATTHVLAVQNRIHGESGQLTESSIDPSYADFNLMWSAFTSILGVFLMLSLRKLISGIDIKHIPVLACMEGFVSVGTLVGVCIAWIFVDCLLKVNGHLLISLVTLGASLTWCKVLAVLLQQRQSRENNSTLDLKAPLLPRFKQEESSDRPGSVAITLPRVKLIGTALGFVVGLFIQFSSLGANYLLQAISTLNVGEHMSQSFVQSSLDYLAKKSVENKDRIVFICFSWSFITSLIGIILLVAIRFLVSHVILLANMEKKSAQCFMPHQENAILHLECFYAFGAVLGLNAAWAYTDFILGLECHISQSVCALVATLIWCMVVLHCCRPRATQDTSSTFLQVK